MLLFKKTSWLVFEKVIALSRIPTNTHTHARTHTHFPPGLLCVYFCCGLASSQLRLTHVSWKSVTVQHPVDQWAILQRAGVQCLGVEFSVSLTCRSGPALAVPVMPRAPSVAGSLHSAPHAPSAPITKISWAFFSRERPGSFSKQLMVNWDTDIKQSWPFAKSLLEAQEWMVRGSQRDTWVVGGSGVTVGLRKLLSWWVSWYFQDFLHRNSPAAWSLVNICIYS